MDLSDKGKHCSEELCHQLDLLPLKCKACSKYYCSEHFKYESHNCEEAFKFNFKIPTCQHCNQPVEFKRGKDLDLCLAEHLQKCSLTGHTAKQSKSKCHYKHCKSKEIFVFECDSCSHSYCTKHRVPEVHSCSTSNQTSCSSQYNKSNKNEKMINYFSVSSF